MEENLAWFKVDDAFFGHPKVRRLSLEAIAVWLLAGSWSAFYMTDGFISEDDLGVVRGTEETANELVEQGLWFPEDDGWRFKEWDRYQPTKAAVEQNRDATRERTRVARENKAAKEAEAVLDTSFDEFWSMYPRKKAKPQARTAYGRAIRRSNHQAVMLGLKKHVPNWTVTEERFIPYPATWLNRDGWNDEPDKNAAPKEQRSRYEQNMDVVNQVREMESNGGNDPGSGGADSHRALGS